MKRIATCCFTGHRPEKMSVPAEIVIRKLIDAIEDAFSDGFTDFITGIQAGRKVFVVFRNDRIHARYGDLPVQKWAQKSCAAGIFRTRKQHADIKNDVFVFHR